MDTEKIEEAIVLGAWVGRRQAFSGMAGRCSAADAQCLLTMREEKKYKTFGMTWDEFCPKHLGVSRAFADKTIRLFEEFGETYFHLAGLIPISPEEYRRISGSVSAGGVQREGQLIAIAPQNAGRLADAVEDLKQRARLALPKPAAAGKPKDSLCQILKRLQDAVGDLDELLADGVGKHNRALLMMVVGGSVERLSRLDSSLRTR